MLCPPHCRECSPSRSRHPSSRLPLLADWCIWRDTCAVESHLWIGIRRKLGLYSEIMLTPRYLETVFQSSVSNRKEAHRAQFEPGIQERLSPNRSSEEASAFSNSSIWCRGYQRGPELTWEEKMHTHHPFLIDCCALCWKGAIRPHKTAAPMYVQRLIPV